jgi:hypothetical protein
MVEADGAFFRTTDMTLAAVLACQGYKYQVERLNSSTGAWVFDQPRDSESFDDCVYMYGEYSLRVEPRAFVTELSAVRKAMYNLLGVKPNALKRSQRGKNAPSAT